jgi:hypothetical protein
MAPPPPLTRAVAPADLAALARALGDTPQTLIPLDHLRRGVSAGWLVGSLEQPAALVVQNQNDPAEPSAFGSDPAAVWSVLSALSSWECVNIPLPLVAGLRALMLAVYPAVRVYADVYYVLSGPLRQPLVPPLETRLLPPDDPLWRADDPLLTSVDMPPGAVLAAALDSGRVVATAHVTALSPRYADVGVFTLESYRSRGLSTYAAWLVMRAVLARGLTPVWSTGEDNVASQRVAEKLGLSRDVTHHLYLIPEP